MSGMALGWAKKQAAPCAASKALLVLLGDYADEDGFAWPSIARMAAELQRSDRHVKRLLKSLTDCGRLFGFDVADAGNGRTRPRVYFFPIAGQPPCASALRAYESKIGGRVTPVSPSLSGISINEGEGDTGVTGEGDTGVTGGVTRESPLELPLNPERDLTISLDARASEESDGFEAALTAYPVTGQRVTSEPAARAAWAEALTPAGGVERLTAAVRAFAADPVLKRRDYGAPSFQRWLGEGRWRAYPKTQAERWDQLARAAALDPNAALQSASYGLFQIMGFNHAAAGQATPWAFAREMAAGEGAQLRAFGAFIRSKGLVDELRDKRWAAFARAYNGPAYEQNAYDAKLAAAFARRGGK